MIDLDSHYALVLLCIYGVLIKIYAPSLFPPSLLQWGLNQNLVEEKEDSSNPLNPGNFKKVKLLPDGSARFTRAMGKWTQTGHVCI
ncbi:hypothetical protein EON65_34225 [archaeon]|nr:MAG: hypothetical protein EON65_34225 [archaeon]